MKEEPDIPNRRDNRFLRFKRLRTKIQKKIKKTKKLSSYKRCNEKL